MCVYVVLCVGWFYCLLMWWISGMVVVSVLMLCGLSFLIVVLSYLFFVVLCLCCVLRLVVVSLNRIWWLLVGCGLCLMSVFFLRFVRIVFIDCGFIVLVCVRLVVVIGLCW